MTSAEFADAVAQMIEKAKRDEWWRSALETGKVSTLTGCQRCASPFLRACEARGFVVCRNCQFVHVLGVGEVLGDVPDGSEPVVIVEPVPAGPPGLVKVRRLGLRVVCEQYSIRRDEVAS